MPSRPAARRGILGGMRQSTPVDGFRLAYDRAGHGPAVVLLHGWPGDRTDYREVAPLVAAAAEVITPDLRGFGESDKHQADPAARYSAAAQARSVAGLIDELGLAQPVIAGYDIGSRIAQTLAADRPDLVRALVISPRCPVSASGFSARTRSASSGISSSTGSTWPRSSSTVIAVQCAPTCGISGSTGPGLASS